MSEIINNLFDFISSKSLEKERGKNVGFTNKKYVDLSPKSREIDKVPPSELFIDVMNFSGQFLHEKMSLVENCSWLKSELTRPSFDHFSIAYKNQVFSILIDIRNEDGESFLPPEFLKRQLGEAKKNNLIPCLFPVVIENMDSSTVRVIDNNNWNLFDSISGDLILPDNLVSDKKIEMSQWELHNFAIMQTRFMLKQQDFKVVSFQNVIGVDPQLWFLDEDGNNSWVVIRYDDVNVDDLTEITRRCFKFNGYLAKFQFISNNPDKKIYRGDSIGVKFMGFEKIHTFV